MQKYVAYYRVSTDKQGRSGLGLEAQRTTVCNLLKPGDAIVAEYIEVESGTNSNRLELDRAMQKARQLRATLIVAKLDRLTRNVAFLARLIETSIDLRCADLPAIEGATGRFLLHQMAAVAELEAGMISTRTKAALAAAKLRGTKLGGLRYESRQAASASLTKARAVQQNQAKANAIRIAPAIASLQKSGCKTLDQIAAGLNDGGISTPSGRGCWSKTQVSRALARHMQN